MDELLVFHDGVYLPVKSLVTMAMNAPNYIIAEHYLFSLLNYAAMSGNSKLLEICQKIRQYIGISPYPEHPDSKGTTSPIRTKEEVRSIFNKLNLNTQHELLCEAIKILMQETDDTGKAIFWQKQHWMAVYLVLRDGLGMRLSQTGFDEYANRITPHDCQDSLRIGTSTMTNFSKIITEDKPYYDMKHNPFAKECDTLWAIIERLILTRI